MLGRLLAVSRLVEQMTGDADHAVAADDPVVARHAARLEGSELSCDLFGIVEPRLHGILIDTGLHRLILHARGVEHLAANGAGRSEDQGQTTTWWKRARAAVARTWGRAQSASHSTSATAY